MTADLPRLFVRADLPGPVAFDAGQANYLRNVLRLAPGDPLLVFNGRDGEFRARIAALGKKEAAADARERTRPQTPAPDLVHAFAPLKQARLDYMVEKASEMGAGRLVPVLTQHGQVRRINRARLGANIVEACEQCGILSVPSIDEPVPLATFLGALDRPLIVADEALAGTPGDALAAIRAAGRPLAVLVGPEGGWSAAERELLAGRAVRVSLGPRILRADTAAVALLALVEAALPS
jgi:16S rRNA (uracil1498-N3)-methyltransferase